MAQCIQDSFFESSFFLSLARGPPLIFGASWTTASSRKSSFPFDVLPGRVPCDTKLTGEIVEVQNIFY
jgi:hypothetical protein